MTGHLRFHTPPPRKHVCEARRRHLHGPIRPLEEPGFLARLMGRR